MEDVLRESHRTVAHRRAPVAPPHPRFEESDLTDRTFAAEDHLPRVPLPTLEDSCARFLEWCSPLLTPEELATTEAAVADLLRPGGAGRTLHAAVAEYDATPGVGSWLDQFWPSRYLGRRDRIALNANFFFLFRDDTALAASTGANQVERAAAIVSAAVDYKLALDEEKIPPVTQRGQQLSMWQNKYLFSETRIPGAQQDSVRVPYTEEWPGPSRERHILVFYRSNMFRVDVIGPDGAPYAPEDLQEGLRAVLEAGAHPARTDTAVGHLTTKARAEWAASREALLAEPANAAALDTVERALFCVCLEDFAPRDELQACDHLLHGDSANRWFDKAVSFIVFADGGAGINVEHCGLDGTTILSFVDTLLETPVAEHAERSGARVQGKPPSNRSSSSSTTRCAPTSGPRARRSPATPPRTPPRRCRSRISAPRAPSSSASRPTRSPSSATSSRTGAARASPAPPTNPSPPASTATAAPRPCAW